MLRELTDKDLWDQIKRDNTDALSELFKRYYFPFVKKGLLVVPDIELVKDSVSEVFYNLWRNRHTLSDVGNVKAYMNSMYRNQVLLAIRENQKYIDRMKQWDQTQESSQISYEEILVAVQQKLINKEKIHRGLALLTPRQKEYIRLKFFEGLTYEQVAQKTGQSIKTVYNTIYKALRLLRQEINL